MISDKDKDSTGELQTSPKPSKGVKEEKKLRESMSLTNIHKTKVGPEMFRKLKMIGRGDVGSVYLVEHKETKKLYAMKVLTKEEMLKRNKVRNSF
jgi:protein-serine/threonine kinase